MKTLSWWNRLWLAITFAEAGETDAARACLPARDRQEPAVGALRPAPAAR